MRDVPESGEAEVAGPGPEVEREDGARTGRTGWGLAEWSLLLALPALALLQIGTCPCHGGEWAVRSGVVAAAACGLGVWGLRLLRGRGSSSARAMAIAGTVAGALLVLLAVAKYEGCTFTWKMIRESALLSNLSRLRRSVEKFQADTGAFPATLSDLTAAEAPSVGAGGVAIPPGSYEGPYLEPLGGIGGKGLPQNPFMAATEADVGRHWRYSPGDGSVRSAVDGVRRDGTHYKDM